MHLLRINPSELTNPDRMDLRLKLQKTVYLLKYTGEPGFDYPFSIYLRGPYSIPLTRDYYSIEATEEGNIGKEELAKWFFEKDISWQEAAATMLLIHEQNKASPEDEFKLVKNLKPWITFVEYQKILDEMKEKGIQW
jgi:uncharacterized protein YwgA